LYLFQKCGIFGFVNSRNLEHPVKRGMYFSHKGANTERHFKKFQTEAENDLTWRYYPQAPHDQSAFEEASFKHLSKSSTN